MTEVCHASNSKDLTSAIIAACAMLLTFAAVAVPVPLYAEYKIALGLTDADISLTMVSYLTGVLTTLFIGGSLSDALGRRPLVAAALLFGSLACALYIWLPNGAALQIARMVQGVSCGLTMSATSAFMLDCTSQRYRTFGTTIASTGCLIGMMIGSLGIGIYATGGETADVGDLVRTIIVDSTVTCRMKRSDVIDNANIRPGDVIVGLSSCGQATYEKEYNGGMGSNGLTSARHDVFAKYLAEKYPETYDKSVPEELVYSGSYRLTDPVEGAPVNAGKLVLSPTRTYAPVVKKVLDEMRADIHGMVHCTGGAQTKVLHFVGENCRVVKDNMFPVPPLFKAIAKESGTDWSEMYKVFNMGHRLEVYLAPEHAEQVIAIAKSFNIDAQIVGHIEEGPRSLTIKSEFGEFNY